MSSIVEYTMTDTDALVSVDLNSVVAIRQKTNQIGVIENNKTHLKLSNLTITVNENYATVLDQWKQAKRIYS